MRIEGYSNVDDRTVSEYWYDVMDDYETTLEEVRTCGDELAGDCKRWASKMTSSTPLRLREVDVAYVTRFSIALFFGNIIDIAKPWLFVRSCFAKKGSIASHGTTRKNQETEAVVS